MRTFVFLTAYGLADDLLRCYEAANSDELTWLLYLHSQRKDVVAACEKLVRNSNVVYFPYGENRGMSKSINEAILFASASGANVLVSLNDDVLCPAEQMKLLAASALRDEDCAYVDAFGYIDRTGGHSRMGFSCCAWAMRTFERIGYFDEYFYPFYFMDADWRRRAALLGYSSKSENMPGVIHAGSKTITHVKGESDWLGNTLNNTRAYYVDKWGGDQWAEVYQTPFNDPDIGLTITDTQRHNPYPAHRPSFLAQGA